MSFQHQNLALQGWSRFSLAEQLADVGSEVYRALKWQKRDKKLYEKALERVLELLDLTIKDMRWRKRLKEITRLREVFCDTIWGEKQYKTELTDILKYLDYFAFKAAALKNKENVLT